MDTGAVERRTLMWLGDLIDELKKHDPKLRVRHGFSNPHSYRGYYDRLAFEPTANISVEQMLAEAERAVGETYEGYKGGDFKMDRLTDVYVANWGECGEELSKSFIEQMFHSCALAGLNPEGVKELVEVATECYDILHNLVALNEMDGIELKGINQLRDRLFTTLATVRLSK